MLSRKVWIGLIFLVVFLPSTLLAQGMMMNGKWWHNKSILTELELTDAERQVLDEKYTDLYLLED